MATVTENKGDAIAAFFDEGYDVFMHVANCQCVMGAGIAKQVKQKIPELYDVDQGTSNMKPANKLGGYSAYAFGDDTDEFPLAINLYGQLRYGRGKRHINYAALTCAVLNACGYILDGIDINKRVRVVCPKLGCGLAGGDWEIIKEILEFAPDRIEWHVYEI